MTRYMKIKDTDITSDKSFINPESEKITVGVYFHFDEEIGYVLDEDANVELRLKKPVKGQEGVVEVDGKLYFQFDNNLYEIKINGFALEFLKLIDFNKNKRSINNYMSPEYRKCIIN